MMNDNGVDELLKTIWKFIVGHEAYCIGQYTEMFGGERVSNYEVVAMLDKLVKDCQEEKR